MTEALVTSPADESAGDPPPSSGPPWVACPGCGWTLYAKRLERNLWVCPECSHHLRLTVPQRIAHLTDQGSFSPSTLIERPQDPLSFADLRPYGERLLEAAHRTGVDEGLTWGTACLGGHEIVLAVMDFDFMAGSMGVEVGRRVTRAAELALERRLPLITVCASGGARMQEGVLSLVQMARTSQAFARLHEAGLLTVCLLTDPTYGGVSASFALLGSVVVAERGAHIGFAGPRVVAQIIREALPPGFQTAEFLLAHGLVDRVEDRAALRPLLIRLLALHSSSPDLSPALDDGPRVFDDYSPDALEESLEDPWDVVQAARDVSRPTTLDYLRDAFDDFIELHGDRLAGDDAAIVAGVGALGGRTVVVIGQQKGHAVKELVARNFGMPGPEGYRKAMRLMEYAERFGFPLVTLVDTPGAHPGLAAEEHGQASAIAHAVMRIGRLRTPVVSVVIGEGGSGGALALCSADRLLMLQHSYLSVISPEGCAAILWRSAVYAPDAARALHLRPTDLLRLGVADAVVPEPAGGAHADPVNAALRLRSALEHHISELVDVPADELLTARLARFEALDDVVARPLPGGSK